MSYFIEKISHFFADNRPLSLLLLVVIAAMGLFSFVVMPKQYNPEIVRPAFFVTVAYDGATPAVTLDQIGYELIEQLRIIQGVDELLIKIEDGALLQATAIFAVGEDQTKAKSDILTTLANNERLTSGAVQNVAVAEVNPETIPVLQIAVSSPTKSVTEVRQIVEAMRPVILSVPEVSDITIKGGDGTGLFIEIEPAKMALHGLNISDVVSALSVYDSRLVTKSFEGNNLIIDSSLVSGEASVASIANHTLKQGVTVGDIARVYEGETTRRSYTLYRDVSHNTTEVVMIGISKTEGSSAPAVTRSVLAAINQVKNDSRYEDLSFQVVSDDGVVASNEITNLTINLFQSIIIVALVLFLFLSARAALVVLITVPLTFLAVLAVGYVAGETINRITLFALILSLGLLVDASIVVVDIIYDHIKRAYTTGRVVRLPVVAAEAIREVGVGLVLSAITSVVVFLPMFYITGMMGPYMGPIAFFVPVALIASLFIAIILTPFISISLLKADEQQHSLALWFQKGINKLTQFYSHQIRKIVEQSNIRKRLFWLVGFALAVAIVLPVAGLVHFQMLPKADRDQMYVYVDLPQGTAREATRMLAEKVVTIALEQSSVVSAQMFVAGAPLADFNGLFKGSLNRVNPHEATIRLNLLPTDERSESSTEIATQLRSAFATELASEAAFVRLMEDPPGPPVQATFVAKLSGDADAVRAVAQMLEDKLRTVAGVVDINDSLSPVLGLPTYQLQTEKVAAIGVTPRDVSLWHGLLGQDLLIDEITSQDRSERSGLYVSVPAQYRQYPASGMTIPLVTSQSDEVALGSLLTTSYVQKPAVLYLEDAVELSYVTAEIQDRSIVYVMISIMSALIQDGLDGYTVSDWNLFGLTLTNSSGADVTVVWGGEWEMTLENFRDLGIAMGVALFLVYAVLVAQYRSFSIPGYILLTVPLALIGILFGFLLLDQVFSIYLTATALIGFIALIGIVVNNAIIFLEYVEQAIQEGVTYPDALVAAGTMRLRPILATSLTTVLGSLTIASDPVWSGLAWSIVFGLSLSTVLTLVVLPALLMVVHKPKNPNVSNR